MATLRLEMSDRGAEPEAGASEERRHYLHS